VWLVVHELSFYVSAKKEKQQTIQCEIQGIYKENSKKGTIQCLVPKQHHDVAVVVE
jgi:hypothetical protein